MSQNYFEIEVDRARVRKSLSKGAVWLDTSKLKMATNELEKVNDLSVNSLNISESQQNGVNESSDEFTEKWGFPMEELYKLALKFYKGMHDVC